MGATTKTKREIITTLETDIGRFDYYANMVVAEVKEGVHVTVDGGIEPLQAGAQVFGYGVNFVYISHRVNSYSIDPTGYYEAASMFPNFKALVIVATNKRRRMLANLERLFMKRPVYVFDNLETAMKWAEEYLENKG